MTPLRPPPPSPATESARQSPRREPPGSAPTRGEEAPSSRAGQLTLQPDILAVSGEARRVVIDLRVPAELAHFAGHFPGLPILPGVVQVDWAIRLGQEHFALAPERFLALKALKFTAPVRPGTRLELRLDWHPEAGRLDFAYRAGGKPVASGQVLFAGIPAP